MRRSPIFSPIPPAIEGAYVLLLNRLLSWPTESEGEKRLAIFVLHCRYGDYIPHVAGINKKAVFSQISRKFGLTTPEVMQNLDFLFILFCVCVA